MLNKITVEGDFKREDRSERVTVSRSVKWFVSVGDQVVAELWPRELAEQTAKELRAGKTLQEALGPDWEY